MGMDTLKKCIVLGVATLAFASALVLGSDDSLRREIFGSASAQVHSPQR
jgi:hypothetical protein